MTPLSAASTPRVAVVGCKHTTKDLILGLQHRGYRIDHCLTIGPELGRKHDVAGYLDLRPFLDSASVPFTVAETYTLKSETDRERILALKLDLLLVMGWQRLIPDWLLQSLRIGAFGMHGSSRPLPHGRGRSPMNWSLIQNKTVFYTHLFRYLPGVDDGPVVGVQLFDITALDDCRTLHFKNTVSMIQLCARHLPDLMAGTCTMTLQAHGTPTYYPKRAADDGLIYWCDTSVEIYNLIRAVTRPFPGAFTYLDDDPAQRVLVWRGIPFDTKITWPAARPGQIVQVFEGGSFVVRTGDASLLVLESEGCEITHEHIGRRLGDLNTPRKVWQDLPA